MNDEGFQDTNLQPKEIKKRRKEILLIFIISFFFVFLTWFEIRLFSTSQQLPFYHSIFFFGLVNFNIIILLFLLFLVFRNIVKVFVERKGKIFGSSLKAKLIAAFVSFTFVPTVLLLIISVFYIHSSFEKWFSVKMLGVLKSSLEIQNAYYFNAKKKNYHFAHEIADNIKKSKSVAEIKSKLKQAQQNYALDSVEYYPSMFGTRYVITSEDENVPLVPALSIEFLQKGIQSQVEASIIHPFAEGNLVRAMVPVQVGVGNGAVVVSSFIPLSLISRINDVTTAYEEFRDINPLQYPLKSIYMIIFIMMTLVILLAAVWFGFYLAKQLSIPLVQLGLATKRVAEGVYTKLNVRSGSEEISTLIESFNQMTTNLERSEKEVELANENLKDTLKYLEVVLANVSTGVISLNKDGKITTINRHASELLKIDPTKYIGQSVKELLTLEYFRTFSDMLKMMQDHKIEAIQKEIKINVQGESIPLLINLSILKDASGADVGKVLVFDDLTPIMSAQRAAAWTEVARRIAHEIKNPLTPIKLSAERLQKKFGNSITDTAFNDCTTMIIKQVDDLKSLVNEFSQFARLPQSKPVSGSINKSLEEAMKLFTQAHPQISFKQDLDVNVPDFKFDHDQIRRVLVNLIDNSISAMENVESPELRISSQYENDTKVVRITVSDNGQGIPASDRARVFEPYFSTKETGTGLGLAIVKRIIEDHNGFIRILGNNPNGTKIVIELPVNEVEGWKPSTSRQA